MRKLNKNNGITLIALVISIIVMLILVAVSISMAVNGGLFNYAGKAVGDTQNAIDKEKELAEGRIKVGDTWYDSIDKYLANEPSANQGDGTGTTPENPGEGGEDPTDGETISTTESYIGYYADVDGDGTVDGVIYADLAVSKSGIWNGDDWSNYEYTAQNNLKEYVVSQESCNGAFGTKPVLKASSTEGTDRFYVMALEDIKTTEYTTFYWYNNAYGKLDGTVESDYNDFGEGKRNTVVWLNNWNNNTETYGEQNARDLWGVIQESEKYSIVENENDSGKWFVPSKAEWSAFGDYLYTTLGVTESNYGDYNLNSWYWSSSLDGANGAYGANFNCGYMGDNGVSGNYYVRLSATF